MKIVLLGILFILCGICLWKVINRDLILLKISTADLRNRVVGARLQKDGKDPYYFKWTENDGLRYYDPFNIDSLYISNIDRKSVV